MNDLNESDICFLLTLLFSIFMEYTLFPRVSSFNPEERNDSFNEFGGRYRLYSLKNWLR